MENIQVTSDASRTLWQIDPKNSGSQKIELTDPEGWYRAKVSPEGPIVVTNYIGRPCGKDEDDVYLHRTFLHITNLDDMISRLIEIRKFRLEAFGNLSQGDNLNQN